MTVQPDQSPLVDRTLPVRRQGTQARLRKIGRDCSRDEEILSLSERVQQILASHPPLTAEQRARIIALLR